MLASYEAEFAASWGRKSRDLLEAHGRDVFGVNIIPHTAAVTTFGTLQPGSRVNIEIDTLARYVARLVSSDQGAVTGAR